MAKCIYKNISINTYSVVRKHKQLNIIIIIIIITILL